MRKITLALFLLLVMSLVISACGKSQVNNENSSSSETKAFTIDAKNFEFDMKEIKVNKGDNVKITLKNSQGNHSILFDGYNKEVKGNKTISFVASKSGVFDYKCATMCGAGHSKMAGKLIVQ